MNIQNLMAQAQKMQKEITKKKEEIDNSIFEGNSEWVKVEMNGKKEIEKVNITFEGRIEPDDKEMLEDMIKIAINDAVKKIDQEVENKMMVDELKDVINLLSEVQKRRLKMYYFEDMTLKQIADIEGCSPKNVFKSIEQAKENIKKNLKN